MAVARGGAGVDVAAAGGSVGAVVGATAVLLGDACDFTACGAEVCVGVSGSMVTRPVDVEEPPHARAISPTQATANAAAAEDRTRTPNNVLNAS